MTVFYAPVPQQTGISFPTLSFCTGMLGTSTSASSSQHSSSLCYSGCLEIVVTFTFLHGDYYLTLLEYLDNKKYYRFQSFSAITCTLQENFQERVCQGDPASKQEIFFIDIESWLNAFV